MPISLLESPPSLRRVHPCQLCSLLHGRPRLCSPLQGQLLIQLLRLLLLHIPRHIQLRTQLQQRQRHLQRWLHSVARLTLVIVKARSTMPRIRATSPHFATDAQTREAAIRSGNDAGCVVTNAIQSYYSRQLKVPLEGLRDEACKCIGPFLGTRCCCRMTKCSTTRSNYDKFAAYQDELS